MSTIPEPVSTTADRELVTSRVFDAPRELVFAAFTDTHHISRWWGPRGFSTTTHAVDLRPGGSWRFTMHGPDGTDYPNLVEYVEVDRPNRLVYRHSNPDGSVHFDATVTFEAQPDDRTRLTLRMVFPTAEALDEVRQYGAVEGARDTLQRLSEHLAASGTPQRERMTLMLPSALEFSIARAFDAPRELVFEAWTRPEHVRRWWGCHGSELTVCEADVRPGGAWRYVMRAPDGSEHPFRGEYLEVTPPDRVVHTSIYDLEPYNAYPSLVTAVFTEHNGGTLVTETTRHETTEARDGHLASGMEWGAAESLDRLAALLAEEGSAAR